MGNFTTLGMLWVFFFPFKTRADNQTGDALQEGQKALAPLRPTTVHAQQEWISSGKSDIPWDATYKVGRKSPVIFVGSEKFHGFVSGWNNPS